MLTQQTMQQLQSLNLLEMARKWQEQQRDPQMAELSFDERFGLLVDSQSLSQHNKRIARLLSEAKLRLPQACVEDVDFPKSRELDKPCGDSSGTCRCIEDHHPAAFWSSEPLAQARPTCNAPG